MLRFRWIVGVFLLFTTLLVKGQCPTYEQITTATLPQGVFSVCNTNVPSLDFQVMGDAPSGYQIVWGDGATHNGTGMTDGQVFSHTYPSGAGNYTMQITRAGCPTATFLVAVENPTKAKIGPPSGGVTKVCAPGDLAFTNESIDPSQNSTYIWNFGDGTGNQQFDQVNHGLTLTHTYDIGTVDCNTTVTLVAYNYCNLSNPSVAQFSPIQIWDVDKAGITSAFRTYCFPDTRVAYTNVTDLNCELPGEDNVDPRRELWTIELQNPRRDSVIGWRVWWPSPGSANPEVDWRQVGTYTVRLADSNFCGVTETQYTIDIIEPPVPDFSVNKTEACVGESVVFTNNSGAPANRFQWDPDGDGNFENFNGASETYSFAAAGTYVIDFYVDVSNASPGCQVPQQLTVIIRDAPVAAFDLDPTSACNSATVNFQNKSTASGNTSYSWDFGNGATSAFRVPPPVNYTSPGIYEITLTATSDLGCEAEVKDTVIIFNSPTADFDADNHCLGNSFSPDNQSTPAIGDPNLSYLWGWDDGSPGSTGESPSHTYDAPGVYRVFLTVTSSNGCTDTEAVNVTVYDLPEADFTPKNPEACSPAEFTFNITTQSNVQSFAWSTSGGQTATGNSATFNYTNNSGNTQNRTVTLVATSPDGCQMTETGTARVFSSVMANFEVEVENECTHILADFRNLSSGNATNFQWDFGDGSPINTQRNPEHEYVNSGSFAEDFEVTLIAITNFNCRDTIRDLVPIDANSDIEIDVSIDSSCSPMTVQFVASPGAVEYVWEFPDGSSEVGILATRTFENQTTGPLQFPVKLDILTSDSCTGTVNRTVTVFPQPTASISSNLTNGCSPLDVQFTNNSNLGAAFLWKFKNGTTSAQEDLTDPIRFTNASSENSANYDVTLVVTSAGGCIDSAIIPIEVKPVTVADFAVQQEGCSPLEVDFINQARNGVAYDWDFGNGVPNSATQAPQNIVYENNRFDSDTTYTVSLFVRSPDNCTSDTSKTITVYPKPQAAFNCTPQGCPPLEVTFNNESIGAQTYAWSYGFGDASTNADPTHIQVFDNQSVDNNSQRNIQLVALNSLGCADTAYRTVLVYPNIFANYVPIPNGCTPHTITASATSRGAVQVLWDFNDGGVAPGDDVTRILTNPGITDSVKVIYLTVENSRGCQDRDTVEVTVYPEPDPEFTVEPKRQRFPEATISVDNTTAGTWIYEWDYDDGFTPGMANPPDHTFDTWGTYVIRVEASSINGCRGNAVDTAYIDPPFAVPGFMGEQDGCSPFSVNFTDTSQYAVQHYWEFGDGTASAERNPTHLYFLPGVYDISLTVTGPDGTPQVVEKQAGVSVYESAQAFFSYNPTQVKATIDVVDFENRSRNADTYEWDFGDGNISNEVNPSHFYERPGVYDIILIANNQFDCPDTFLIDNGIEALETGNIVLPTAFTPNPEGTNGGKYNPKGLDNNVFFPIQDGVETFDMKIFNRWGELIFQSKDVNIGWDGYFNGVICQQDVYVYRVVATFEDGRRVEKVGDVTLLR